MPRSSRATHSRILAAAYVLFRKKGFTRVNVDEIAAAARITKRTLYSHFRSKDAMLAEVLESQHQLALDAFHTFGNKLSGSTRTIVRGVFQELTTWTTSPRWSGSGFTRLVVELADLPGHPARSIAKKHKELLESHLSELLGRSGIKNPRILAREIWLLFEGGMVLVLIHGDRSYLKTAEEAALKLLPKAEGGKQPHQS